MRKYKINMPLIGITNAFMLLLVSLFKEIRIFSPFHIVFQGLLFAGILVGGVTIIHNFVTNKEKTMFDYLCYGLVITLIISSVLSPQWRSESIKDTAVTGICVLGIFQLFNNLPLDKKNRLSLIIMRTIMISVTIISFSSIVLFFISPFMEFPLLGQTIQIGMSKNRLFGLYHSLSLPIAATSFILGFNYRLNPEYTGEAHDTFLFYSNLIVNFVFVALSFSYGIIIALSAMVVYLVFFFMLHSKKHILVALLVSLCVASAFLGAIYVTRVGIFSVRNSSQTDGSIDDPEEPDPSDDVWKEQNYGILTGRDTIWIYGLTHLKDRPLIGFGSSAFYGTKVLGTQPLQNLHSVYVQSLVGGGILHSLFSFSVIGLIIVRCLAYSIKRMSDHYYLYNLMIIGILVFSVINGIVESNFLYINRFPLYIFWVCLGLLTFNVSKPSYEQIQ